MSLIEITPDTLHRGLGADTVLVNLETGFCFSLDRVGRRIWELIQDHGDRALIEEVLIAEFDEAPEKISVDLTAFLQTLVDKGLVVSR